MGRAKFIAVVGAVALLGLLAACSATNTGNPSAPEGVELVRSKLERAKPNAPASDVAALGTGNQGFAFDLYQQLAAGNQGNLFFSPYSISTALAMVYAGAAGSTASELAAGLHYDLPEPALHAAFNQVDAALESRAHDGVQLSVVNAAWTAIGTQFEPAYLDVLALNYGAGIYAIDFAAGPEAARMRINDWVSEQTHDRIPELFPQGSLTPDVALVLTNAIYFKAKWEKPFKKRDTASQPFHAPAGDVTVPMMTAGGEDVSYIDGDGFQAFELPYQAHDVRMMFVLPDMGNDAAIEAGLSPEFFATVRAGMASPHNVVYSVPRFTNRTSAELVPPLQALGVQQLFANADLSRMSSAGLFVSKVVHQAFVLVDEEGTEAAAATGVVASRTSAPPPPIVIVLDRPFLYAIYDEPTGEILFLGRLRDPGEEL